MSKQYKFKPGDIVLNEWREKYDREWDTGVIIEDQTTAPDHECYLVARIAKDKDDCWYFTGQEIQGRPGQWLKPTDIKLEDTGLEL